MDLPDDRKYAATHEWVRIESDGTLTVGITEYAQESLGEIMSLELPEDGKKVSAGEAIAVVESIKAASEIHAPVSGHIVTSNGDATDEPGSVNADPYGTWLFKLTPDNPDDVGGLLTPAAYKDSVGD